MKAKSNKKILIIVSVCVIIITMLVLAYLLLRKNNNATYTDLLLPESNSSNSISFPLTPSASYNSSVKELQKKLNKKLSVAYNKYLSVVGDSGMPVSMPCDADGNIITELKVDGYFGPLTTSVVVWAFGTKAVSKEQFNTL